MAAKKPDPKDEKVPDEQTGRCACGGKTKDCGDYTKCEECGHQLRKAPGE